MSNTDDRKIVLRWVPVQHRSSELTSSFQTSSSGSLVQSNASKKTPIDGMKKTVHARNATAKLTQQAQDDRALSVTRRNGLILANTVYFLHAQGN